MRSLVQVFEDQGMEISPLIYGNYKYGNLYGKYGHLYKFEYVWKFSKLLCLCLS